MRADRRRQVRQRPRSTTQLTTGMFSNHDSGRSQVGAVRARARRPTRARQPVDADVEEAADDQPERAGRTGAAAGSPRAVDGQRAERRLGRTRVTVPHARIEHVTDGRRDRAARRAARRPAPASSHVTGGSPWRSLVLAGQAFELPRSARPHRAGAGGSAACSRSQTSSPLPSTFCHSRREAGRRRRRPASRRRAAPASWSPPASARPRVNQLGGLRSRRHQ